MDTKAPSEKNRAITLGIWLVGLTVAVSGGILVGIVAFLMAATGASLLHRWIMGRGMYE